MLGVSEAVVRRLIAQKTLPAKQIVKFAPWMIERTHLDLPAVHRAIRLVHTGRRDPVRLPNFGDWVRIQKGSWRHERLPILMCQDNH